LADFGAVVTVVAVTGVVAEIVVVTDAFGNLKIPLRHSKRPHFNCGFLLGGVNDLFEF